ncbi:hypothetical protein B0T24DRAFT_689062 [Lasiosphaeria ovina]|uniref:Protein kinase domain-containing protein n=1 Tax=Lasiosphaeria ovina TaxID=92902 RepID=A0AAE0NMA4_9PEZI|nr:hypothetical protein B0T24DRAFT_689062 [Lasiosphaeria ovina]
MDSSSATPVGGPEQAWFRDGPAVEPAKSDRSNSDYVSLLVSHLESIPVLGNIHPYFMDQTFEGELGVGGFFDVQKKTIKHDGKPRVVAIKRLKPTFSPVNPVAGYAADPRALRTMLREIQVMETMKDSPFILELLDVGSWPDSAFHSTPFLVVELATGGTLTKFLDISKANETDDLSANAASGYHDHGYALRKSLLVDVASGLHALHQNAIFHTDLKPDNILVFGTGNHGESYHAKISDFGSSIIRNAATPDNRILFGRDSGETDGYKAPELYAMSSSDLLNLHDPELRKLDIFSFGVVLIETISSCRITGLPFDERKVTSDSVTSLSFLRDYIGEEEWNETVLRVLEVCLSDSSSRCDNLPDILALLGQDSQESFTTAPSLEGVFTSKTSAFLDQGSKMMINSGSNIDMPSLFKDTSEYYLVSALSHVFGCGVINFDQCCEDLLEAARRGSTPAQTIYRRFHEALYSISLEEDQASSRRDPCLPPTAIADINPELFGALESLDKQYPDNYLAHQVCFSVRLHWATLVYDRLCETTELERSDDTSWDIVGYGAIHDERIEKVLGARIESLKSLHSPPGAVTDYDLLISAAIIFGKEQSTDHLELICELLDEFGVSLNFHIESLGEENLVSPLMLASYFGNTNAVRILTGAHRGRSCMSRFKSGSGQIPLHYLFAFPDDDVDEICSILADGVAPQDMHCETYQIAGYLCNLFGSPLDFSLKVGSVAATRSLWKQLYHGHDSFLATITMYPGVSLDDISHIPQTVDIPPLEAFAIRCWGSMQPSIWEFFLSIVDEDPEIRTKLGVAFREPITSGNYPDRGCFYFGTGTVLFSLFQTMHMVLHGPKYTERLIWQLRQGMEFFIDVGDPNFIAHLLTPLFSFPEPHLQVAVIEACKDLATSAEAAPYDTETLKAIMFTFNSKAAAQHLSVGHSLGFVMSKTQPLTIVFDALAAAAAANDAPAFRRVVQKSTQYGINLVDEGAFQFLGARFAKSQPKDAGQYFDMLFAMNIPPSSLHWSWHVSPGWLITSSFEQKYSETGRILWDAVKYNNLALVLLLVDQDPSRLYPGLVDPGVFFLLCVNDKHKLVLEGLLNHLGPSRSLECLQKRTRTPSFFSMVQFVSELSREDNLRFDAIQSFVAEVSEGKYDMTLGSQAQNEDEEAENLNTGEEVGHARATSLVGKVARRWKLSLVVVDHVWLDATSLWASATSGKSTVALHLLACMLSRIWKSKAVSDASARAWLESADTAFLKKQKQLMLILDNFNIGITPNEDILCAVTDAWKTALQFMENIVTGQTMAVWSGEVLLAMSSWHLYPDFEILGDKATRIRQKDPLIARGGIVTIGLDNPNVDSNCGISWSLPLSHLRYYGKPVVSTGSVNSLGSRVPAGQLLIVALGSAIGSWAHTEEDIEIFAEVLEIIEEALLKEGSRVPGWFQLLSSASKISAHIAYLVLPLVRRSVDGRLFKCRGWEDPLNSLWWASSLYRNLPDASAGLSPVLRLGNGYGRETGYERCSGVVVWVNEADVADSADTRATRGARAAANRKQDRPIPMRLKTGYRSRHSAAHLEPPVFRMKGSA